MYSRDANDICLVEKLMSKVGKSRNRSKTYPYTHGGKLKKEPKKS